MLNKTDKDSRNKIARLILLVILTASIGIIMAILFIRLNSQYQRTLLYVLALGFAVIAGYVAGRDGVVDNTTAANKAELLPMTDIIENITRGHNTDKNITEIQAELSSFASQQHTSPAADDKVEYLHTVLGEISSMQASHDLFDRYQYFFNLVEKTIHEALGPSNVTMWCPDEKRENLIECVILPDRQYNDNAAGLYNPAQIQTQVPCKIPLTSEAILRCLQTTRPYYANHNLRNVSPAGKTDTNNKYSLHCDACMALYRKYGQPLLINIELGRNQKTQDINHTYFTGGDKEKQARARFYSAAQLINIFWQQLQVANQREWIIEHDEFSGALRDDKFMYKAKSMAQMCKQRDEPFALVVITVRGFRRMFAGHSEQWKNLSGLFGMTLRDILKAKNKEFLLGKMSDDVFALMLAYTDKFLARNMMDSITVQLDKEINHNKDIANMGVMALDIQWAIADHRHYADGPAETLNRIYAKLFDRNEQDDIYSSQIILNQNEQEQEQEVLCR